MTSRPSGVRANLPQMVALVMMSVLVGGMVGQERTVVPLIAEGIFGVGAFASVLSFIGAFGAVKAFTNLAAGTLADRMGRRPVLLIGWLIGLPVPLLLMWAPSWELVLLANALLGVNQGLTWSAALIMKLDLAGRRQRGLVAGLNEAAGYSGMAVTAWATGYLAARYGLRPAPFVLGVAYAALGTAAAWKLIRETQPAAAPRPGTVAVSVRQTFVVTTLREPTLSSAVQAGFMNNLNDVAAWGLFPLWFARFGFSTATIGALAAIYPAIWGVGQLVTGPLSDRLGRKSMITAGMALQAAGLGVVAAGQSIAWLVTGSVLLGVGTALVYPTLLAAVSDIAAPRWRGSALGVYRFWRDLGLAVGALVLGQAADALGLETAIWTAAALTAASAAVVAIRMGDRAASTAWAAVSETAP